MTPGTATFLFASFEEARAYVWSLDWIMRDCDATSSVWERRGGGVLLRLMGGTVEMREDV